MDTKSMLDLVDELEDNIEDLGENLEGLLQQALSATTQKLPLLDRSKLYVLVVYAIESLLFSYLKLHGVSPKGHPVFKELTRVKLYFEKIKTAEQDPVKPRDNLTLDKQATGRLIKHALAGNDKYDLEKAEREARERLIAKRKLRELEASMKQNELARIAQQQAQEPEHEPQPDQLDSDEDEGEIKEDAPPVVAMTETYYPLQQPPRSTEQSSGLNKQKKRKGQSNSSNQQTSSNNAPSGKKVNKKAKKRAKQLQEQMQAAAAAGMIG